MTKPKPRKLSMTALLTWHGLFAGSYVIAYVTAETADGLHVFAGYVALALLAVRLLAASLAPAASVWSLPWASAALWRTFGGKLIRGDLSALRGRTPFAPLSGLVLLGVMTIVTLTGVIADLWSAEDLHEGIAEGSLAVVLVHVAIVSLGPALRAVAKRLNRTTAAPSRPLPR